MAIVTLSRRLQMLYVLARRRNPVMTTGTRTGCDGRMIEDGRNPCIDRMAVITICNGRQMPLVFACRRDSVMATGT